MSANPREMVSHINLEDHHTSQVIAAAQVLALMELADAQREVAAYYNPFPIRSATGADYAASGLDEFTAERTNWAPEEKP